MKQLITDAHPILPSMDYDETIAFYQKLGFAMGMRQEGYLIMRRDGIELHFWACSDRKIAENSGCCLRSEDVDALYAEFIANGVKAKPPEDRAWGMREFYVIDPSGNLLRINQRLPARQP
jgi:catechol 2,3-dioxygenase-like lactoylglutathione lyase family enzyme